jgi:L-cysteine:1D-myo-inositol 2-amino-2-deoxy-alpha-D-glucopyranoside ligase
MELAACALQLIMQLWDSYQHALVELPEKKDYSLYVCGVTPYDSAHIGHAATFTYFDVLVRHLEQSKNAKVTYAQNITDVDDSIIEYAQRTSQDVFDVAGAEEKKLERAMDRLGVRTPDVMPKVSDHIDAIRKRVQQLHELGTLYELDGDWYFDTSHMSHFSDVTGLTRDELTTLFDERGGNSHVVGKRDPLDFVVWQKECDNEPSWESDLGRGRPGWHIECTAMILEHFGSTIDIHGGGEDLFFPHHACEQVQSSALGVDPVAHAWMHSALVSYHGEKMSKSLGNLVYVDDAMDEHSPNIVRIAILLNHYRVGFDWNDDLIARATQLDDQFRAFVRTQNSDATSTSALVSEVSSHLDNDLDTPSALEAVKNAINNPETSHDDVRDALSLLGLNYN